MSYEAAVLELRQLLADTETHKKATKKSLVGPIDGTNVTFFTYDKRIVEDTLQVFVGEEEVNFTLEDNLKGEITLAEAPAKNSKVRASYYFQFWVDEELKNFLNKGAEATSQWTTTVPDKAYLSILPGLKTAALLLAASLSTDSLISFLMNRRHSEEFNVEQDGNDDNGFSQMINAMRGQSKDFWTRGMQMRDDFYQRQGKRNAPAFGIKASKNRNYGPMR